MKAKLIFNPHSGRARALGLSTDRLLELLRSRGIFAEVLDTQRIDGVAFAVSTLGPGTLCIIAGGDGTMFNALQGEHSFDVVYGILPLGTANNLANSLGIPMDIEAAIRVLVEGRERKIDLGRAGGRIFTQAAGAGFHANAFHIYGHHRERSFADGARAFVRTLRTWHPKPMAIRIDGEVRTEEAMQITVANTPVYGRGIIIAPDASLDDGLLDTVIIRGCATKLEVVQCIIKLMEGMRLDTSNVTRVSAKHVEIAPADDAEIPVHADAEPIGFAPVTIEVLPSCLRLIVPA